MSLRSMLEEQKGAVVRSGGFCVALRGGSWGHLLSFVQPEEKGGGFG